MNKLGKVEDAIMCLYSSCLTRPELKLRCADLLLSTTHPVPSEYLGKNSAGFGVRLVLHPPFLRNR